MALAQADTPYSMASIKPDDLNRRLDNTIREPRGPVVRSRMLLEVVASKRIDLIQVCFANLRTCSEMEQLIVEMPDGELKQRATIVMLRTANNLLWPPENPLTNNGTQIEVMREPFISVIPQLLPHVKLNENWLKYQIGRTRLADDMEAILDARGRKPQSEGKPLACGRRQSQCQECHP